MEPVADYRRCECGRKVRAGGTKCFACAKWASRHPDEEERTFSQIMGMALADVPAPDPAWARKGRCRSAPLFLFFPTRGEDIEPAKQICAVCPVIEPCREYGLAHGKLQGVWGGLSERQRKRIREGEEDPGDKRGRPPNTQAPVGSLDRALVEVATRPGCWARVATYQSKTSAYTTASLLRTGKRPHPEGDWEFQGRRDQDGGSSLWVLFHGEAEPLAG